MLRLGAAPGTFEVEEIDIIVNGNPTWSRFGPHGHILNDMPGIQAAI